MIKKYETRLLNNLQNPKPREENVPLANVRKAKGSLAYVKGNPLTKTEITINIIKFNQSNVGKNPKTPVYLFGLTDYYAGYPKASIITPPNGLVIYNVAIYYFGIVGKEIPPQNYLGLGTEKGDFFELLSDDPTFLNTFSGVRISCQNIAYGTFLNSFVSDLITIDRIRLIIPIADINQFINPLRFTYQTLFGKTVSDDIDPRAYITSTDFQQQICDIPINLPIDKNLIMSFEMEWTCNNMSIILFVSKVEPLTHK
jgi:hypothetical protein